MTSRRRKRQEQTAEEKVEDYRYDDKRKNNPEVGLANWEQQPKVAERVHYSYDPHLDPELRFDSQAARDDAEARIRAAIEETDPARRRSLLEPLLRAQRPWLNWAGKAEHTSFDVDTVSLHVHERLSAQAIIRAVRKNGEDAARQLDLFELFADPQLPLSEAVEFYQHDVDWANRLILGDSLVVMNSLLHRELMAGQVQMIYVDPPYGISYNSNFQPRIHSRDVRDGRDEDLTREPAQIKAYRDTWTLGIHSYLTYLRDRLLLSRELLANTGSIFVQISDENIHLVRTMMDEVFGKENFVAVVPFVKTSGFSAKLIDSVADFLLWYARDISQTKYRSLFREKTPGDEGATKYRPVSRFRSVSPGQFDRDRLATSDQLTSQGELPGSPQLFNYQGRDWSPRSGLHWKTTVEGLTRLAEAERLIVEGNSLRYLRFLDDYPVFALTNVWTDIGGIQSRTEGKVYVVQTATLAIERCLLMTTAPGDLVLDPTCGSGTTAYVAEQWGRRWITMDTSRVALALARQRLLTASFPYYRLAYPDDGVKGGFDYKTVPHIMLKSISQNTRLDPVFEEYHPRIEALEAQIAQAEGEAKQRLEAELAEVKREKQAEVDRIIAEDAPRETLYDQPNVDRSKVRVSGPFTVESIPTPAIRDVEESPILEWEDEPVPVPTDGEDAASFIVDLIAMMRKDGLTPIIGDTLRFNRLNQIPSSGILHAEGELALTDDKTIIVAVSFGPQYGPVTIRQVEDAVQQARGRYDGVVLAGFTFDGVAQAFLNQRDLPLTVMGAYLAPDILVGDLLKTTGTTQTFTLFGQADIAWWWLDADGKATPSDATPTTDAQMQVEVRGVDLYNPETGQVTSDRGQNVAAWFLDTDYDRRTFNICQAFFPAGGRDPWRRLARALRGVVDEEAFEALRGTQSLPFTPGGERRIAVKVIDHRGNEMLEVFELESGRGHV